MYLVGSISVRTLTESLYISSWPYLMYSDQRRAQNRASLSEYVNMVVRLSLQRHFSHHDAPGGLPGIQHCSRGTDGEHTNPECK